MNEDEEFLKELQRNNSELFMKLAQTYTSKPVYVSRETLAAKLGRTFMEYANTSPIHLSVYSSLIMGADVHSVLAEVVNDRKRLEKELSDTTKELMQLAFELKKLQYATKGK